MAHTLEWSHPGRHGHYLGDGGGGEERERFYSFRPLPLMQVDDLPPHSTYYNYAHEQENQHTNHNVLELGTENDSVLEL